MSSCAVKAASPSPFIDLVKGIPTTTFDSRGEDTYLFSTRYCNVRMFSLLHGIKKSNLILRLAKKTRTFIGSEKGNELTSGQGGKGKKSGKEGLRSVGQWIALLTSEKRDLEVVSNQENGKILLILGMRRKWISG